MSLSVPQADADRSEAFRVEVRRIMTEGADVSGTPVVAPILTVPQYDTVGSPTPDFNEAIALALIRINQSGTSKFPVQLPHYTVGTLPTASTNTGNLIYVTNEAGGAVPAFSDGSNWRRVTDRAIVS